MSGSDAETRPPGPGAPIQYASQADMLGDTGRSRRSVALDKLAAKSQDDLLAGRRLPKWPTDFALLRRAERLRKLREEQ